jgi:hypothetical protein
VTSCRRQDTDTTYSIPSYPHTPHTTCAALSVSLILSTNMDVYTTSFTYPRRSRHIHSTASSFDFPGKELRASGVDAFAAAQQFQHNNTNSNSVIPDASAAFDAESVQKLASVATSMTGCPISYFPADHGRGWNFHITGAYQQVMSARGMILKDCPVQVALPFSTGLYLSSFASCRHEHQSRLPAPKFLIPPFQNPLSNQKFDAGWTI